MIEILGVGVNVVVKICPNCFQTLNVSQQVYLMKSTDIYVLSCAKCGKIMHLEFYFVKPLNGDGLEMIYYRARGGEDILVPAYFW